MNEQTLPTKDTQTAIGVDNRGQMTYASASATGHVEVVLPTLPGSPNGEERMLAKDFGPIVLGKIESAMNKQGYLKSGPQQGPAQVLAHFASAARGAKLLDVGTLDYMARLSKEFAAAKGDEPGEVPRDDGSSLPERPGAETEEAVMQTQTEAPAERRRRNLRFAQENRQLRSGGRCGRSVPPSTQNQRTSTEARCHDRQREGRK